MHYSLETAVQKNEYRANTRWRVLFSESEQEYLMEYNQTVSEVQYGFLKKGVRLLSTCLQI